MSFARLFDIPYHQQEHYPQEACFAAKVGGEWVRYTTQGVIDRVNQVSASLLRWGIRPGDKIAVISDSRPEWNFVDYGMQQIGAVNVPVYPQLGENDIRYILDQVGVRLVFAEDADCCEKVDAVRDDIDSLEGTYTFEEVEGVSHWGDLLIAPEEGDLGEVEAAKADVGKEDLATIVYTSGTTGRPKGVMHTHRNIVSNVQACIDIMPVEPGQRALSFLPLNHMFERMISYLYVAAGVSVYYAESVDAIGDNLREVSPHTFTTVPRLLEKVYERIVSAGKAQPLPLRLIFYWALNVAQNYELHGRSWLYEAQCKLLDPLVFAQWRQALGGNVIAAISGGAALNPRLARVFTAAGIPVLEGYGLTETAPVLTVNRYELEGRNFGSVGKPIDGVQVQLAEDGEVLAKGPNIMEGYYEQPGKTEELFDEDGWFHTGDVGEWDDGFLKIIDRKDALFKTSGGKFVAPQPIENRLKESFLVDQAMVVGRGRKMVTALIAPDFQNLKQWCRDKGVEWPGRDTILDQKPVRNRFAQMLEEKNEGLSHTEKVKKFRLVPDEWTVEGGELTPTLKIKREILREEYEELIEEMYAEA
ncbi:MAG: long-chain fatty acid--CoA ligase [Candidatus Promineifilaceae bacterium]|nr:long-chain fatty acid--CoA ligase [Candidatus Promineifilaceae bacterium]